MALPCVHGTESQTFSPLVKTVEYLWHGCLAFRKRTNWKKVSLLCFMVKLGCTMRPASISVRAVMSLGLPRRALSLFRLSSFPRGNVGKSTAIRWSFKKFYRDVGCLYSFYSHHLALVLLLTSKHKGNMWERIKLNSLFMDGKNEETRFQIIQLFKQYFINKDEYRKVHVHGRYWSWAT